MGAAQFDGFLGVEAGVNAAEHHVGSARTGYLPEFVSPQSIGGVNANTDHVARLNALGIDGSQRFIDQNRVAVGAGSCAGEHVEPSRSNDSGSEGHMAGIDQMNLHPPSDSWAQWRSITGLQCNSV